jgi:Uma2 family endonuclease
VVEIDITNDSWGKFPVYALLGVPEIWRYNGREVSFYALRENDEYGAIATSLSFPFLTSEVLTGFLSQSKTAGQKATRRAFRQWLRQRLAGASFTPPQ